MSLVEQVGTYVGYVTYVCIERDSLPIRHHVISTLISTSNIQCAYSVKWKSIARDSSSLRLTIQKLQVYVLLVM